MESAAASAFLKSVMGRLFVLLEKEYNKHKGLGHETQSIQLDLRMIAAAMDDQLHALGRNHRTAVARLYREEMLDLAHDMEDSVDRFMHRVGSFGCKQQRGGAASLPHRFAREVKKIQSRSSFADEIHKLKKRLAEVRRWVNDVIPAATCDDQPAESSSSRAACNPVGIAKPVEQLLSLLDEVEGEPAQLRVISIVGFGGLGKTTLARKVYDSPQAKAEGKFKCRAWVAAGSCSSEKIDGTRILREILQQVRPQDDMDVDGEHTETSLREYLKNKRYLIVIDDVRTDEWSIIQSALKDNGTSSRIIITTTTQSVANMCSHGNGYVYQVNALGEEDSKQIAFPSNVSPELEHGSEALLEKCDGLPLALVSVSNYLKRSGEATGELCERLSRNLGSNLKESHGHDSFSELRRVLLDSYESLSSYALTCMLYLGIFPNNHTFKRKVVIRRWLAEGYAQSNSICSEQDIADENFDKLIDQNIIQPIERRNNSHAKRCKFHGIMHEFTVHKSMSQRFITISSRDHPRVGVNSNNARHLSIHAGGVTEWVGSDEALSRVRSLTVFGDAGDALSYVSKCKLIRVLDLEECNHLEADSLKHICKLWHLKYLSLGGTICEFPRRCLEGLHCLETLDLRKTKVKFLPVEAIQLPHLAYLFGKLMLDKHDLKNVKKMRNLEKFLSGNKSNLQTLAGFVTDGSKGLLQLMGHMKKLGKVKMWCRQLASTSNLIGDLSQAIQQFTKVPMDRASNRSLSLDSEECSENFLSSLDLEPCAVGFKYDLRSLKLHGKIIQLPPFATLLSGLTELCISTSTLTSYLLSELVSFRRLLYLKLVAMRLESFKIEKGALPSLRRLCFVVQSLITALPTIDQGALPNLISLQLLCQDLSGLSDIEIRSFRHLKEILIHSKVTPETKQDWERAAKNHPNRPTVFFPTMSSPIEGEELVPCATREKRKRCVSSEDGLNSNLKKMRLSENSTFLPAIVQPGAGKGTQASSSIPVPMLTDSITLGQKMDMEATNNTTSPAELYPVETLMMQDDQVGLNIGRNCPGDCTKSDAIVLSNCTLMQQNKALNQNMATSDQLNLIQMGNCGHPYKNLAAQHAPPVGLQENAETNTLMQQREAPNKGQSTPHQLNSIQTGSCSELQDTQEVHELTSVTLQGSANTIAITAPASVTPLVPMMSEEAASITVATAVDDSVQA